MSQIKKKQVQSVEFCGGNYALIPLLLVIFLVPLIMRAYIYDSGLSTYAWYPNQSEELDIFLYWKGIFLVAIAALMTVILVVKLAQNFSEIKKEYWIYFLLGYGLLTLISTLVSPYRNYGFTGIYEQFESVWVILSYCVVTLYAFYIVRTDEDLRVIRKALLYLLLVLCFIGVSQLIGKDFFESDLGRRIMVSERYANLRENLTFNFSGTGIHQVYMTLYNPNYVGAFTSLMFPIITVLIFASRKKINKIVWICIALVLLICTLGSGSKTFILSLGAVAVIAVVFFRKALLRYWKQVIAAVVMVVVCGTLYFSYMNVNLFQYVKNALVVPKTEEILNDVEMTDISVVITYKGSELNVQYTSLEDSIYYMFFDENGTILDYYMTESGLIQLADERFEGIQFAAYAGTEEYPYYGAAIINGSPFLFVSTDEGYKYVNAAGKTDKLVQVSSALFTGYERFASGRGYIWSRTIPLLGKYFFLGSGADTFVIAFPQNDYIGKFNSGYYGTLITKPHNLYLQIGVQHGGLALICFLAVNLLYFIQSCKLYWKADLSNSRQVFGIGLTLGIIGYLISGMANDSSVALAPLFWALLGIGFAVNRMNKKEGIQVEAERSK